MIRHLKFAQVRSEGPMVRITIKWSCFWKRLTRQKRVWQTIRSVIQRQIMNAAAPIVPVFGPSMPLKFQQATKVSHPNVFLVLNATLSSTTAPVYVLERTGMNQ